MPKRDRDKLLREVQELADRFSEADDLLSPAEVRETLRSAGCDPDNLRENFYRAARDLAARLRAKGKPAPVALRQAIEFTSPSHELPTDLRSALDKAKRWLSSFAQPSPSLGDLRVLRAYRASKDLTDSDRSLLDELEEQLKRRAKDAE
jgi:hypothetical protein